MHYTAFVGLAYQECLLCDTWLSSVIRCVGRELSKVVLYMTARDAQWWCHGQSVPIATSVICAGHTSLFKSGFRLVTSIGGNYILCCTIQDTSRDINSLYYMYWVYAIVRKRIRYNKRYCDYVQCCTIEDTSRDINNLYYMCKLYMPICQCLKVDSLHQGVVSTVLYNTRYFRRHKQLVLFVPLFESGLAAWKGVVTTTQGISREKLFPN